MLWQGVHQPHAATAHQGSKPSGFHSWMTKSFTRRASRCTDSTSPVSNPSLGASRVSASSGGPSNRRSWSSSCMKIEQQSRQLILGHPIASVAGRIVVLLVGWGFSDQ